MGGFTRRQFIGAAAGLPLFLQAQPAGALSINPRSAWAGSGYEPKGPLPAEDVRFLIVHHSASNNGHTSASAPGILRSWFNFHTGPEKGWNDIAYNFVIDNEGVVWEARHGSLAGAVAGDATGGNQGFTQLVCIIGDYNAASPTPASLNSLVQLLAWLSDRYGISTAAGAEATFSSRGSNLWPAGTSVSTPTITGHRTMSRTTCPGDNLNSYVVGGLMADVEALRGGGSPPPASTTTVPPPDSSTTTTSTPTTSITATTTTSSTGTSSTSTSSTTTTSTSSTTSTTVGATTTTVPVTTTTPPEAATSSSATVATTMPPTPTTSVVVAAPPPGSGSGGGGLVGLGLAAVAAVGGLLVWRQRRMG